MSNLTLLSDNRTNWLSLIDETDDLDNVNAQLKHFLELCDAEDISSDSDLVSAYKANPSKVANAFSAVIKE